MLSIGLMSGTSMDGIDAALIETDGSYQLLKHLGYTSLSYQHEMILLLKIAEFAVQKMQGDVLLAKHYFSEAIRDYLIQHLALSTAGLLQTQQQLAAYLPLTFDALVKHSTDLHVLVVRQLLQSTAYSISQIDVVGYHGQTLFHQPENKITVAIGDGQALANQLNVIVVNDFRRNDILHGGQGAPLAPLYHFALAMKNNLIPVAIVNCGGIANITWIPNREEESIVGFDTGPGNGLLDRFVKYKTDNQVLMDINGGYAKKGSVNEDVLQILHREAIVKNQQNFLRMPPPKALDSSEMHLPESLKQLTLEDGCRTLARFTAETIFNSQYFLSHPPETWIIVGGGAKNPMIVADLNDCVKDHKAKGRVAIAEDLNWNTMAIEAELFAYLSVRSRLNKFLSYPKTTNVLQPVSGGHVYFPE